MLATANIQIKLPEFCEFSVGVSTADFIELIKHAQEIRLEGDKLHYSYASQVSLTNVRTTREIPLFSLDYGIDIAGPLLSVRMGDIAVLTEDNIRLSVGDGWLALESDGHVKTRSYASVEQLDGEGSYACTVRAKDMRIIEEIEGDRVMCFFESCVIVYGFEDEATTAMLVRVLNNGCCRSHPGKLK